ncbi:MAG TPA: hypothetical protein VIF83_08225 [Gemmatimonadaceae bacterium]
MRGFQAGTVRFRSVADAVAKAILTDAALDCRLVHGRINLMLRQLGGTRWPEAHQVEYALQVARVVRAVLAAESKRSLRKRANRAIVIIYEDAFLSAGCDIVARWECVVPAIPA